MTPEVRLSRELGEGLLDEWSVGPRADGAARGRWLRKDAGFKRALTSKRRQVPNGAGSQTALGAKRRRVPNGARRQTAPGPNGAVPWNPLIKRTDLARLGFRSHRDVTGA